MPNNSNITFEQAFRNIDDVLWKDAGVSNELDYVEQTSWILFLKYLDDLEKDRATEAALRGTEYNTVIDSPYMWDNWAAPKSSDGKLDHNKALSGDDLIEFVNNSLFPYFKKFKDNEDKQKIEYKIGVIFSEIRNKIISGYTLRNILDIVDNMRFRSQSEKHELSHLYEAKIKNMGNAGRNGGEYYTPRPLIKTIVKIVDPHIGDKIYDGAVGSGGFIVESFDYLTQDKSKLSPDDWNKLQKETFYAKEKKPLPFIIGLMNMILHGIDAPNIIRTNTLTENLADIQEKDRYSVVIANPPFGGKERVEVQQNFPIKTGETAFLFLQHFIKILKAGGKAGIIIKNTFLSNTDNASVSLRKLLLESCNLHTILDLPSGTFTGAGVKTVVLFFEKGLSTKKVWYYQLNLDRNLGKTNPLNEKDLAEFVELQKIKADSLNSWSIDVADIDQKTFDLSVKNPNKPDGPVIREPKEIVEEIRKMDEESSKIIDSILKIISNVE